MNISCLSNIDQFDLETEMETETDSVSAVFMVLCIFQNFGNGNRSGHFCGTIIVDMLCVASHVDVEQ
jgi:hypothetical protein